MVYVLLCLMFVSLSSAQQTHPQEPIEQIRLSYQRVLREHYGMAWSDAEIDDYLYGLIAAKRARRAAATTAAGEEPPARILGDANATEGPATQSDSILRCQPRLNVLPVTQFYPKQLGQKVSYRPSCVALHRCSAGGGCCREHHTCSPKTTRNVTIALTMVTPSLYGGAEEHPMYLTFENHTECHCLSSSGTAPPRCFCAWPYVGTFRNNQLCACECSRPSGDAGNQAEEICNAVSSGQRSLPWPPSRNAGMTKMDYRSCATNTHGMSTFSPRSIRCGLPACSSGSFSFANWSCPADSPRPMSFSALSAHHLVHPSNSGDASSLSRHPVRLHTLQPGIPTADVVTEAAESAEEARSVAKRSDLPEAMWTSSVTTLLHSVPPAIRSEPPENAVTHMGTAGGQNISSAQNVFSEASCASPSCTSSVRFQRNGAPSRELSDTAHTKLLAWTRPGVVLEKGGGSARTRLGRELWGAAGSLQQRHKDASCAYPEVKVVVDSDSSASCSLHDRSRTYLIRTTRGNLLCGVS